MTGTLEAPRKIAARTALPTVLDARVVTGSGGGPDKTILNSPRYLTSLGYRMLCGYLTPPGDPGFPVLESKAKQCDAPLLAVPDRGPFDWRVARQLLRICHTENVAIWHGHDYKTNALGLFLRRFHKMHLVTTVHGWVQHTARTPLYYRIDKWCLPRYEKVICVSDDLFQSCLGLGVKQENCLLIENAIDADDYRRTLTPTDAKKKLGFDPIVKLIGAVGRLSEEKGFDVLIRAVKPLIDGDPSIQLMIVGEGADRPRLASLIADLQLTKNVSLPGWRSDVRDVYEAMDLFVLSSRREGLPNVLLEALALEVPVVATHINGVPKLIRDGVEGRLVPSENVEALTTAICELLNDESKCAAFRTAGRERIKSQFSFPARMKAIADLYDALLGGPP